ncbi:nucleotide sugar dehydrogenase [Natronorubrum sulfidifaciens]|uniref:UDP-N-acetyl-D-mannosamine dehydrogenase n=1 Tax=Natronorubrum sulfidifaciens JCM 14089 TaxID=1230460 RepID=L9VY36_9EURY|nr:nucleotide sugar dehydrogenase [Natronorubrum sulfidifaciens]ELY42079.1 nucleotide sugar dehydrogenase [Natronorubrum sulfidifaciens JCM 14089]
MKRTNSIDTDRTTRFKTSMQIACVGLGFVGYNSAVAFSRSSYPVIGVDTDAELIESIRHGDAPFETTALDAHIDDGTCEVTTTISDASDADAYIISVPTPLSDDDTPDLSYVRAASRDVSTVLEKDDLVVVQSTIYPGCTEHDVIPELERSGLEAGTDFGVSHVPERYSPGNDRSERATRIIGSITDLWRDVTAALYEDVADDTKPVSSLEVAETTKLVENIQRDVNIALVNELATAMNTIGIDVSEVLDAAATKWNFDRYDPGLGVGGHCLPVDPHYFLSAVEDQGETLGLVPVARDINDSMPARYLEMIRQLLTAVGKRPTSAIVAVLGVTYKPNVSDLRNSAAVELVSRLQAQNITVEVYDSQYPADEEIEDSGITNGSTPITAVRNADVLVVGTPHDSFREFDPDALAVAMAPNPILIDPQRLFDPAAVADSDLHRPLELETGWAGRQRLGEPMGETPADGTVTDRRENHD